MAEGSLKTASLRNSPQPPDLSLTFVLPEKVTPFRSTWGQVTLEPSETGGSDPWTPAGISNGLSLQNSSLEWTIVNRLISQGNFETNGN